MATDEAQASFGLDLKKGDGAETEVFASIGSMIDFSYPNITVKSKDVTTHKSADKYEEFKAVMLNGGDLDFVILMTKTTYDTLQTTINGLANHNWQVPMPNFETSTGNHGRFDFNGHLSRLHNTGGKVDDFMKIEASIKINGKPSLTEEAD